MGSSASRPANAVEGVASEKFLLCFKGVLEQGQAVEPGTIDAINFVLSTLQRFDDAVMTFIGRAEDKTAAANYDILEAYREATEKTKLVALDIQKHAVASIVELNKLVMVGEKVKHNQQDRAMEGLNLVNVQRLNLPESIIEEIEMAKAKYQDVIRLCEKACEELLKSAHKRADRLECASIGLIVAASAVLVISLLIPPAAAVAVGTVALTAPELAVISGLMAASMTAAAASASVIGVAISQYTQLEELVRNLEVQKKILAEAQEQAGGIIVSISKLQVRVESVRIELNGLGEQAEFARRSEAVAVLGSNDFLVTVEQQRKDLEKLKTTCRKLFDTVLQAYDNLREAKGFMVQHILKKSAAPSKQSPKDE